MAEKVVSIDCGKADTKVCVLNEDGSVTKVLVPTRVSELTGMEEVRNFTEENAFLVRFEDQGYAVGSLNAGMIREDSKKSFVHKVISLALLGMQVEEGDSVNVVIGCPFDIYRQKEKREEYGEYILPKGKVVIEVNGLKRRFSIEKRLVLPEGYGAFVECPELFPKKMVGVIDIGGFNVNGCYFVDGKLDERASMTCQFGKDYLIQSLKEPLAMMAAEASFTDSEVELLLSEGVVPQAEERSKEVFSEMIGRYLDRIMFGCKRAGWNVEFCELVFIGGTSLLLEGYIKGKYPRAFIPKEGNYLNALGNLKIASEIFSI